MSWMQFVKEVQMPRNPLHTCPSLLCEVLKSHKPASIHLDRISMTDQRTKSTQVCSLGYPKRGCRSLEWIGGNCPQKTHPSVCIESRKLHPWNFLTNFQAAPLRVSSPLAIVHCLQKSQEGSCKSGFWPKFHGLQALWVSFGTDSYEPPTLLQNGATRGNGYISHHL